MRAAMVVCTASDEETPNIGIRTHTQPTYVPLSWTEFLFTCAVDMLVLVLFAPPGTEDSECFLPPLACRLDREMPRPWLFVLLLLLVSADWLVGPAEVSPALGSPLLLPSFSAGIGAVLLLLLPAGTIAMDPCGLVEQHPPMMYY